MRLVLHRLEVCGKCFWPSNPIPKAPYHQTLIKDRHIVSCQIHSAMRGSHVTRGHNVLGHLCQANLVLSAMSDQLVEEQARMVERSVIEGLAAQGLVRTIVQRHVTQQHSGCSDTHWKDSRTMYEE